MRWCPARQRAAWRPFSNILICQFWACSSSASCHRHCGVGAAAEERLSQSSVKEKVQVSFFNYFCPMNAHLHYHHSSRHRWPTAQSRIKEREKMTERSISKQEIMYQVLPNRERTNGCKIYNVFVVRHVFNAVVVKSFHLPSGTVWCHSFSTCFYFWIKLKTQKNPISLSTVFMHLVLMWFTNKFSRVKERKKGLNLDLPR